VIMVVFPRICNARPDWVHVTRYFCGFVHEDAEILLHGVKILD